MNVLVFTLTASRYAVGHGSMEGADLHCYTLLIRGVAKFKKKSNITKIGGGWVSPGPFWIENWKTPPKN